MNTTNLVPIDGTNPFTEGEITVFEEKYMTVFKNLSEMVKQKKQLEEQEKKVKAELEKAMDEYGIKSMDNAFIKFTRIAENPGKTETVIDLDKLKEEEPDLFNDLLKDYPKQVTTGKKKAYVTFTTK